MPLVLIQQLKNVNDIQSLVRRMGSRGVHFDGKNQKVFVFSVSSDKLSCFVRRTVLTLSFGLSLLKMIHPATVAMELVMLAGTVSLWYGREREDN